MKRILLVMLLLVALSGCSTQTESKPVVKEYTYSEEVEDGVVYDEKWTIEGMDDDVLYKTTTVYTYTFDDLDVWSETIEELKVSYDEEIEKLKNPLGSKYITIEYEMDGNTLIATEITDYKSASDNGMNVDGVLDRGLMTSKEYYSVEMVCEELENSGYTLVE